MNPVRQALFLAFLSSNSSTILYLAGSLVLARLLSPEEIGIYAVASVALGIAQILREFGVGSYIVQEPKLTRERLRTAFGVLIATSWLLAAVIFLAGTPVGKLYGEPGVQRVLSVLALNFLLIPFGAITLALLKRELRFGARALIEIASAAVSVATSIALALKGAGYMSLAWASVAGILTSLVGAQLVRPSEMPWLPSLRGSHRIFSFSLYVSGAHAAFVLNNSVPDLILGRLQDMNAVGYFTRAAGLVRIFSSVMLQAFVNVALPYFSDHHHDKEGLRESYLRFVEVITGTAWPFLATLAIAAAPATLVLFGDQWEGSIPLVPVLCLAGALTLPFSLTGLVMVASGRPKLAFRLEWLSLAMRISALLLLAPVGLVACAWGQVLVALIMASVYAGVLSRCAEIYTKSLIKASIKSIKVATICAIAVGLASHLAQSSDIGRVTHLLIAAGAAISAYAVAVVVVDHPVGRDLRRFLGRP